MVRYNRNPHPSNLNKKESKLWEYLNKSMKKNIIIFLIFISGVKLSFAKENQLPTDFENYCLNAESNYDFDADISDDASKKPFSIFLLTI